MNREEIKQRLIDMLQELFPEAGIPSLSLNEVKILEQKA